MPRSLPFLAILLAACGEPPPDDAPPLDGATMSVDAAALTPDATDTGPAPAQLPPELLALSTRSIAFADDGTVFLWAGGAGIDRARPPAYVLEQSWMPMQLGLHSKLDVHGSNLYFVLEGTLRRAPIDAPVGVVPSAPLASGLDGMALASAPDGTLFYSKLIVVPVPGGGRETWRMFRLSPGAAEEELVTNDDGMIGDVAWHDGQLYIFSLFAPTIHAVDLAASPHTARAIGERNPSLVYGITTDAAGRIYYVESRRAFRFDPSTGQNQVLSESGLLLAETVAFGRGPLDGSDLYVAAVPNVLLRGAAAAP